MTSSTNFEFSPHNLSKTTNNNSAESQHETHAAIAGIDNEGWSYGNAQIKTAHKEAQDHVTVSINAPDDEVDPTSVLDHTKTIHDLRSQDRHVKRVAERDISVTKAYHNYLSHGELGDVGANGRETEAHDYEIDQYQLAKTARPEVRVRLRRKKECRERLNDRETKAGRSMLIPEDLSKLLEGDNA